MQPFRPTPKTPRFALPIWVGRNLRRLNAATLLTVGLSIGVPTVGAALTGCSQPLFPTLSKIEQTIVDDLQAGKTDSQIASDVCADLGGSASTDAACAQVEEIVQSTVTILIDTGVISGKALANAKAYQSRHSAPAASQGGK